jgi:hypothetical protein
VSSWRRRPAAVLLLAVLGSLTSLLLYFLARPHVHGDAEALALAAGLPVVLAAVVSLGRRRAGPLGLVAAAGLGLALAATALSGGSSLPLKLYRPLATGLVGAACLASVALGRPLLVPLLRALARGDAARGRMVERVAATPGGRRRLAAATAVIGAVLLAEAAATVALALTVPTGTFLVASRIVRFAVLGGGLAILGWSLRRARPSGEARGGGAGAAEGAGGRGAPPAAGAGGADAPPAGAPRERRAWFGPRRLGVGWGRPQTWQARLIVLAVIAAIVVLRVLGVVHG